MLNKRMFALAVVAVVAVALTLFFLPADNEQDNGPACHGLVGRPAAEVLDMDTCVQANGRVELMTFFSYNCRDGRTLGWNDRGWGYTDGPWQAHSRPDGQLVPPQVDLEACTAE